MYRDNMFVRTGTYTASIKVFTRNTWDWLEVGLRKGDVDYILRNCKNRKECVPTLQKRGKLWYLDFAFEEKIELPDTDASARRILAVDLGINSACTCCVMGPDGTVAGRKFLKLPAENDRLDRGTLSSMMSMSSSWNIWICEGKNAAPESSACTTGKPFTFKKW